MKTFKMLVFFCISDSPPDDFVQLSSSSLIDLLREKAFKTVVRDQPNPISKLRIQLSDDYVAVCEIQGPEIPADKLDRYKVRDPEWVDNDICFNTFVQIDQEGAIVYVFTPGEKLRLVVPKKWKKGELFGAVDEGEF